MYLLTGCFISSIINGSRAFKSFELKIQVLFKNLVAFAYYNFYVHSGKHWIAQKDQLFRRRNEERVEGSICCIGQIMVYWD